MVHVNLSHAIKARRGGRRAALPKYSALEGSGPVV